MKHKSVGFFVLLACTPVARAHFVFVIPEPGATKAKVVLSENLAPNEAVDIGLIAGTKLSLRSADGTDSPLTLIRSHNAFEVPVQSTGLRVVHGVSDLGVMQRGGKTHVLIYYPKTILGDAFDSKTVVGGQTPVEIVPSGKGGAAKLKLLAHGKPLPGSEITVILPDGREKKMKTDASGETEPIPETGRFGAWARFWETIPGERDGKKYDEVRHYATLVFDAYLPGSHFAHLPQPASSFGAVESGGSLYVYGGHTSPTHTYWREAVSGKFHRLDLRNEKWEDLPGGPGLQGLNLAAHDGKIYRIGGMAPRNEKGKPADNHSTAECARFDPATKTWEQLPPLPEARSSHDVAIVGHQLIVTGGWAMQGSTQKWMTTLAIMDLAATPPKWTTAPQPFSRRALIAAAYQDKLYVIGGMDEKSRIVPDVTIYDPKTGAWAEGPELPEMSGRPFAPAAVVHQGSLYVSVSDGTILRLNESKRCWERAGEASGRVAHRLVSNGGSILVIGGASGGKNFDLIEAVPASH